MKNLFTVSGMVLISAVLCLSCKTTEEEPEAQYLDITPDPLEILAMETSTKVAVQCDLKWSVSLEETPWAEVDSQDEKTASFSLKTQPNLEDGPRTGVLVIKAGKTILRKEFTQGGLDSFFTPRSVRLSGTETALVTFPATSIAPTVTKSETWIRVTKATKSGTVTLSISASGENQNLGDREGLIHVNYGTVSADIPVAQGQKDVILTDNTTLTINHAAQELSFVTQYNVDYTVSSDSWIRHTGSKAPLPERTETFSVEQNSSLESREGHIVFTAPDKTSLTVTVIQEGMDPILLVSAPGCYGIGSNNYVFASDGWNQFSFHAEADGDIRWRLLNAGSMSAITLSGIPGNAIPGQSFTLHLNLSRKGFAQVSEYYTATLLDSQDGLWWYKVSEDTYFIIQKEAAL